MTGDESFSAYPELSSFLDEADQLDTGLTSEELVEVWELTVTIVAKAARKGLPPSHVIERATRVVLERHTSMSRVKALTLLELVTRKWATLGPLNRPKFRH